MTKVEVQKETMLTTLCGGTEEFVDQFLNDQKIIGMKSMANPEMAVWASQITVHNFIKRRIEVTPTNIAHGIERTLITGSGTHLDGTCLLLMCCLRLDIQSSHLEVMLSPEFDKSTLVYKGTDKPVVIDWADVADTQKHLAFKARLNGQFPNWGGFSL